jgi:hypothetical protein
MATKEFLSKQTKIPSSNKKWSKFEYSLKLGFGSTAPVIKQMWSISSPHLINQFEKTSEGQLVLESWVDVSKLSPDNRIEEICARGFSIPSSGLHFQVGSLKLDSQLAYNRTYEFMLVKIVVGKSFITNLDYLHGKKVSCPKGYNSNYLYTSEANGYYHNYLIFDGAQVLPKYLVHFELDPNLEEGIQVQLCDICQESRATLYCIADNAVLCIDCDDEHHTRGNKLMQRHKRVSITEKPKRFGNCHVHLDSTVEFYCNSCLVPICVNCKMIGSHSTPETSNHVLIKINEAYQQALAESSEPDALLESKKENLKVFLEQIDKRIEEIKRNAEIVENSIYKTLKEALAQLQTETESKIAMLVSAEMEIKRQIEEISWVECFLKYQQEILSPAHFMVALGRHFHIKEKLANLTEVPELQHVFPDIKVEGEIRVTTESAIRTRPPPSDLQSYASSTPKTSSSKFRSQLFNRHQVGSLDKSPSAILRQMIPAKPNDSTNMKFSSILNLPPRKKSSRGSEDDF